MAETCPELNWHDRCRSVGAVSRETHVDLDNEVAAESQQQVAAVIDRDHRQVRGSPTPEGRPICPICSAIEFMNPTS